MDNCQIGFQVVHIKCNGIDQKMFYSHLKEEKGYSFNHRNDNYISQFT